MKVFAVVLLVMMALNAAAEYRKVIGNYFFPAWELKKPKLEEFKHRPFIEITRHEIKGIAYVLAEKKDFNIYSHLQVDFRTRSTYSNNKSDVFTGLLVSDIKARTQNNVVQVDKIEYRSDPEVPEIFKEDVEKHLEDIRNEIRKYYQSRLYSIQEAMEEEYDPETDEDLIKETKTRRKARRKNKKGDQTSAEEVKPGTISAYEAVSETEGANDLPEPTMASKEEL